jgi:hypothetical protein
MTLASFGKNSRAKVVLPAPFGPAITMQTGGFREGLLTMIGDSIGGVWKNQVVDRGTRELRRVQGFAALPNRSSSSDSAAQSLFFFRFYNNGL